ncbi:DNA cytosine methyltransferase [Variovorax boronicumulans]
MTAYYNEFDKKAAAWLRELIKAGHIAHGIVDERSIEDVAPADLVEFTQCHFFAGIGVWSYALRRAGWSDDRPIWTASCPCQPFSQAGEGAGFADERHLWPHLFHLIGQRRPGIVVGEQVASKDANPWVDLVHTDLEAVGYAFGAVAFPSASIGAPHIRDRTYWVANANDTRSQGRGGVSERAAECAAGPRGVAHGLADSVGGVDSSSGAWTDQRAVARGDGAVQAERGDPRPVNGLWRDADWLFCRDGKWRPVEPGTFPLAHGSPARVGRLRGYGNAINAEAAKAFIEAVMEAA